MTPAQVQQLTPCMTPLTWDDVRARLDAHDTALNQAFVNATVLHDALGYYKDKVTGQHSSVLQTRLEDVERRTLTHAPFHALTFWGRLRWLLTGNVG